MKKLLIKLLPNFILNLIIKQKYKKQNISIHRKNIKSRHLIEIKCENIDKHNKLKDILFKSFSGIINIEKVKVYFHPVAIIKVPNSIDIYLKDIGAKSRNMNKKAQKNGISCKNFDWNEYLEDIYNINISSSNRQGRQMDEAYRQYPKKIDYLNEKDFNIVHIGAFNKNKLIGYVELYSYGNFTMTNRILGHKDYLKFGIMNLLIKHCVEYAIETIKIEYINYLGMQNKKNNSLSAFKNRVGFREYSLKEI